MTSVPRVRSLDLPLSIIIAVFLMLSGLWAFRIPIPIGQDRDVWGNFNPDEAGHIVTVIYMTTYHAMAPHTFQYSVTIHPPLYHFLAALVYAAASPTLGPIDALRLLRLLSCGMGAGVVWLTYQAARQLASRQTALLAAGIVAGVPMYLSLSAAVTNEDLAALAAAATLDMIVIGLRQGFDSRRTAWLAIWVAAGILTKLTCVGLLPAALLTLYWSGRRRGLTTAAIVRQMLVVLGVTIVLDGWWFVRNQILYGAPVKATLDELQWNLVQPGYLVLHEQRGWSVPDYLFIIARNGWESFWAMFDAQSRPLPHVMYLALLGLQAAAGLGLYRAWRRGRLRNEPTVAASAVMVSALIVTVIYVRLNWLHLTPQGRYFFPLLLPLGLSMAAGWRQLFSSARVRDAASWLVLASLLLLNVYSFAIYSHR